MNYGYSNNCCSCNNYYSNNDCDCAGSYEDSLCETESNIFSSSGNINCTILLFIIAVILVFCR